jgi:hypothetical protein
VTEIDETDVDTSDYLSSNNAPSWNSQLLHHVYQMDEGMMEREDVRAEQQAESVIRGTESLIVMERKGTLQTQPSFFNDQESDDSDDDKAEKATKQMDRKTMQQILRQHSGHDLESNGTVGEKSSIPDRDDGDIMSADIIGGEPDCEEEFVFQYEVCTRSNLFTSLCRSLEDDEVHQTDEEGNENGEVIAFL